MQRRWLRLLARHGAREQVGDGKEGSSCAPCQADQWKATADGAAACEDCPALSVYPGAGATDVRQCRCMGGTHAGMN